MEIVIKVKREIICVMERVNIFTRMEVITLVTGWKVRCKGQGNCLISKATFNMKVNGGMTISKAKESSTIIQMAINGTNMRVSSDLEIAMDLDKCSIKTETDSKVSLETI